MTIPPILLSITLGAILGTAYGLLFIAQKKRILVASLDEGTLSTQAKIMRVMFSMARLVLFAMLWLHILKSPSFNYIFVIIFFFIAFWGIILKKKKSLHEIQ